MGVVWDNQSVKFCQYRYYHIKYQQKGVGAWVGVVCCGMVIYQNIIVYVYELKLLLLVGNKLHNG